MSKIKKLTIGSKVKALVDKRTPLDSVQKGRIYEVAEIRHNCIIVGYDGVELYENEFEPVKKKTNTSPNDMEGMLTEIINKVRQMYRYDSQLKEALTPKAKVTLMETDSGIQINEIQFDSWGTLVVVTENKIFVRDGSTSSTKTLIEYNGFEELLDMD